MILEVAGFKFDGMNLLDMFSEALVLWDAPSGEIIYVNEAARSLYGYSWEETGGLFIGDIFPGWEDALPRDTFSLLTATHRKKNGIFFPVQITCRTLSDEASGIMMMVASDPSTENMARDSVSLASAIQRGFLPGDLEGEGKIEVRSIYRPMFHISGDFYGYEWDEKRSVLEGHLFDVMGHGVPAALQTSAIMVLFRQAFEDDVRAGASLEEKLRWVNSMAEERILNDSFAAALCFRLDLTRRRLDYCAAGINAFFHGRGGVINKIFAPGSLLGLPGEGVFGSGSIDLEEGDYFLFLSDGFLDRQEAFLGRPEETTLLPLSFHDAYDQLFQVGYTGAARDDQSALCVHVLQL